MPDKQGQPDSSTGVASHQPCGLGRRLLIMAYDTIAVIALLMGVTALLLLTPLSNQAAMKDPLPTLILLLAWFLYLAWCWRKGGLTLGMRAWRVCLVTEDGAAPGWGQCLLRFVVSLLSAAVFGAGFLWSLFDGRRRTWHDMASRTALVRVPHSSDRSA